MDTVACSTCTTPVPIAQAHVCMCAGVVFCNEDHASQHPHAQIEDTLHQFLNELKDVPVDVKFSRLVGRGKYIEIVSQLTQAMNAGQIDNTQKGLLANAFAKETKHGTAVRVQIEHFIDAWNSGQIAMFDVKSLVKFWSQDSPRTAKRIDTAMKHFKNTAVTLLNTSDTASKQALSDAGNTLGAALNGDTKTS